MMSNQQPSTSQTEAESRDPIVLAVDTSSPHSSYAIAQSGRTMATISSNAFIPHSRTFFVNLSTLLKLANLDIGQIDLFAAATGPGSFTGLRVGLAAVKGLAHSLGKPAIGVNSIDLQSLATGISGLILVLIDAGREEVYCGLRQIDSDGLIETVGLDQVGRISAMLDHLSSDLGAGLIVGSGAVKFKAELELFAARQGLPIRVCRFATLAVDGWQLIGQPEIPIAAVLAERAAALRAAGADSEIHAYYVRPSDAEIKQ